MRIVRWLFGLFAFSVLISQSLMDFFSTLFCFTVFAMALSHRQGWKLRSALPRIGLEWIWIGWFSCVALSFALNAHAGAPWLIRLVEFKWILILYMMIGFMRRDFPKAELLPFALLAIFFVDAYSLSAFAVGHDWITGEDASRAGGPFSNAMTYAHSTAMLFCLLGGLVLIRESVPSRLRPLLRFTFAATGLCVFLTFTRGVWLGLFVGLVTVTFLYRKRLGFNLFAFAAIGVATLAATWERFRERLLIITAHDSYDHERWTLWQANIQIWKDAPLLGIGYGENSRRLREYYDRLGVPTGFFEGHAHNQFLHMAAGTGAIGLFFYFAVFAVFIRWNWRLIKTITEPWPLGLLWGALAAQISFLAGGLTEANFEHSKVRFMLMFIWAIVAALGLRQASEPPP